MIYFERGKTIAGNIRREVAASPTKLSPRSTGLDTGNTILDLSQPINDLWDWASLEWKLRTSAVPCADQAK
jgi:hypothetical protein